MNFHDTWFHCWILKIVIKVWVNMFNFIVRYQVIICLVMVFILVNLIFSWPVLVYQYGRCFRDDCSYDEYGHMGIQIGLSLLLGEGKEFLPEEILCFWIYIHFYWSHLALIHVCDCYEGFFLWLPLHVCTIVLWRENFIVFHNIAWAVIFFRGNYWRCFMSLEGYRFILSTSMSMLMFLPVFMCWYCFLGVLWWYFWLEFLLVCWRWFGPFWWWNVFPKLLLTIGSIIEWYRFMSMSAVSRVSKISSIEGVKMMESW